MIIDYINMDRRKDRDTRFLDINSGIMDFRRFDAVVGDEIDRGECVRSGLIQHDLAHYTPGALGAALSHKMLWDRAVVSSQVMTIAEDDAIFNKNFAKQAEDVLNMLPGDWDIILWGWNFDSILHVELVEGGNQVLMRFGHDLLHQTIEPFRNHVEQSIPLRMRYAFGLVCSSISSKGARILIDSCFPLKNEQIPLPGLRRVLGNFTLDMLMNKYYSKIKAYACYPPLVMTLNDKDESDVHRAGTVTLG